MSKVTGEIQAFGSKPRGAKNTIIYSFKLDEVWYSCGWDSPGDLVPGDVVEFDAYEKPPYGMQVTKGSVVVLGKQAPSAAPSPGTQGASNTPSPKQNNTQRVIQYQAATNSATAIVDLAFQVGALTIPAKVKAPDKLDFVLGYIDQVRKGLFLSACSIVEGNDPYEDEEVDLEDSAPDWEQE